MAKRFKVQVQREHYYGKYDSMPRFISYYFQIETTRGQNPKNILEIGIGNKTYSNYMKQAGYEIVTCDFDKNLKPDRVGSITKLPCKNNEFDTVVAFEILEHLPFTDFEIALRELQRVAKRRVIISVPNACWNIEGSVSIVMPFVGVRVHPSIRIPKLYKSHKFGSEDNEHYWELSKKGYSKNRIRNTIKKYFNILQEFHPPLNAYHYFFILEPEHK